MLQGEWTALGEVVDKDIVEVPRVGRPRFFIVFFMHVIVLQSHGSVIAQISICGVHASREMTYAQSHETELWRCVHTVFAPVSLHVRWGAVGCVRATLNICAKKV